MVMLKVSSKSNLKSLAGAIVARLKENGTVGIQSIGAGALNQSIKALCVAKGYVAPAGRSIVFTPSFCKTMTKHGERTSIILLVKLL